MTINKNTKRHRLIGISLVVLNCMTFLIAIAVMALGVPAPGTVTITSPGPNTLIQNSNFTVTGTATPNKQIQVYLNNAYVGQTTSNSNGDWSLDVSGVKNGQINLYAKITEDPFLYVQHRGGLKTLSQIDTATNSVVSTIPAGVTKPKIYVHHPTQPRLYIHSSEGGIIKVIDTDTMESITDIENISSNTQKILISPDGTKLYVASNGIGGNIKVFSTSDYSLLQTISTSVWDIVLTPDGSKLYSTGSATNIKGWNTSDYSPLADINVSSSALRIAINPAGTKLYVSEVTAEQVEVVTLSSGLVTKTISTGGSQPGRIVVSPSGNIAIIERSSTQKILDLATETITGDLGGGGLSQGTVTFNSTGSKAYWGNDTIKIIDVSSNSIVGTVSQNGYGGLVVAPNDTKLFAAKSDGNEMYVIDADTAPFNLLQTKLYPQLESYIELTQDGTKGYATSINTKRIFTINTVTNTIDGEISSDQLYNCAPAQTALNQNETKLYVTSSDCAAVFIIDTATNQLSSYFLIPDGSNFLTFNSDGSKLYISEKEYLIIYDTANATVTDTINIGSNPATSLAITPDDTKLYISDPLNDRIVIFNTTSKSVSGTIPTGDMYQSVGTLAINPAGTILYASNPNLNNYIKISTLSDTLIDSPVSTDAGPSSINFLPDGSKMYIVTMDKVNIFDPATDVKSTSINTNGLSYIYNSGLLRNRVINTATQDIFINTPELGALQTVPSNYTPQSSQVSANDSDSSSATLSSLPITAGEPSVTSEQASGVGIKSDGSSGSSNFFADLPNNFIEAIKATPASVARVFPWLLFASLLSIAGILMLQVFMEYRNINRSVMLANRERSLRAEKKNFLALSAHYLRTPLTIIQSGLELINFKNKKHEADGAVNITKILAGEIENILQTLQDDQTAEPALETIDQKNAGFSAILSPAFLVPVVLVGVISIGANILFISIAKLDLGVINLITQLMFFITATLVFYFVIRTVIISRNRKRAAHDLLEKEKELSLARNRLITESHHILGEQLQHLVASIGAIKVKNQKPLLDVAAGIESFEQTLAKFELAAQLQAGTTRHYHTEQVNLAKLIDQTTREYKSQLEDKQIKVDVKVPSYGNVTSDTKSLKYVVGTLIDNAIKFSSEKSIVSIRGNRTSHGYKLTISDHGSGIKKSQLQQIFKPFSRADSAMIFDKQGIGLSLYLDQMIMRTLGGRINVDSTVDKGTHVTLLLP